jgi:phage protein D
MNNYLGQQKRGTSYLVKYLGIPSLELQPSVIHVHMAEASHDVAVMFYRGENVKYGPALKTGSPVQITWTAPKASGEFIGYVSSITPASVTGFNNPLKIVCIGASFPLKNKVTTIYVDKSATDVVKEIGAKHNLRVVTTDHPLKFPQLSQSGISDWEFLCELAERIGYGLRVDGTTIVFKPRSELFENNLTAAPVFSMEQPVAQDLIFSRTLISFEPLIAEYLDTSQLFGTNQTGVNHAWATKSVQGVSPTTALIIKNKADELDVPLDERVRTTVTKTLFDDASTNHVVHTDEEARTAVKSHIEKSRFFLPARAVCEGDPRAKPYMPVYVVGTSQDTDGYWVIKEATHILEPGAKYTMELILHTDGVGESRSVDPPEYSLKELTVTDNTQTLSTPQLVSKGVAVKEKSTSFEGYPERWQATSGASGLKRQSSTIPKLRRGRV